MSLMEIQNIHLTDANNRIFSEDCLQSAIYMEIHNTHLTDANNRKFSEDCLRSAVNKYNSDNNTKFELFTRPTKDKVKWLIQTIHEERK